MTQSAIFFFKCNICLVVPVLGHWPGLLWRGWRKAQGASLEALLAYDIRSLWDHCEVIHTTLQCTFKPKTPKKSSMNISFFSGPTITMSQWPNVSVSILSSDSDSEAWPAHNVIYVWAAELNCWFIGHDDMMSPQQQRSTPCPKFEVYYHLPAWSSYNVFFVRSSLVS